MAEVVRLRFVRGVKRDESALEDLKGRPKVPAIRDETAQRKRPIQTRRWGRYSFLR